MGHCLPRCPPFNCSDSIMWHENANGNGTYFRVGETVANNASFTDMVFAADLDDDGDMDILSALIEDDRVMWHENDDGLGRFSAFDINPSTVGAT